MPTKAAAILLFLSLPFAAGEAQAETLSVGGAGADHASIQAAVDAASEGATILVQAGRYAETVEIAKPLTLRAEGAVVVDAGRRGSAIVISADGVTVEGIEVRSGSSDGWDAGLLISGDGNTVVGVHATAANWGIVVLTASGNTIRGSEMSGNRHDGLVLAGAQDTVVEENTFSGNGRAGLWMEAERQDGTSVEATGNRVSGNTVFRNESFGIALNSGANDNEISGNSVHENGETPLGAGILLNCGPMRNLVSANEVAGNDTHGILLESAASLNRILGNEVSGSATGIGIYDSNANEVVDNVVRGSASYGIRLDDMTPLMGEPAGALYPTSTMNLLHHNDLSGNRVNAFDRSGLAWAPPGMPKEQLEMLKSAMLPNQWDDGTEGNHYDDFDEPGEGFVDENADNVGEVPHPIPGGIAIDRFPLAEAVRSNLVSETGAPAGAVAAAPQSSAAAPGACPV